jgi:hypothetical protein
MDPKLVFLMNFYGLDAQCAAEILSELRDTKSLESLAGGYRVAQHTSLRGLQECASPPR